MREGHLCLKMGPASSMAMSVRNAAGSSRQNTSSLASAPQASQVSPLAALHPSLL